MSGLAEKTAFVTGATSGIGRACARGFAQAGARLVICGRRADRLAELSRELGPKTPVHAFELDVRDSAAVSVAIAAIPDDFAAIDLLINNAGLSRGLDPTQAGVLSDWDEMIDTNVKGLLYVTRAVVPGMIERGHGHVINLGSIAGREVYPKGNVYCASKHAVDAITKGLRVDLSGTNVKVSTVDPGLVNTEFGRVRFHGDQAKADAAYKGMEPLVAEDVADVVIWVASRPERVNVAEVVLFPIDQASSMVVHRRT